MVFTASLLLFADAAITSTGQWLPNLFMVHSFFPPARHQPQHESAELVAEQ
jgi:hypothetical protein